MGLLGCLLIRRKHRLGVALLIISVSTTYVCSIPLSANALSYYRQSYSPLTDEQLEQYKPGVIVVLAGGLYQHALEYGSETIHLRTLGRIRYAARLARATGLPVLASGGVKVDDDSTKETEQPTEGALMAEILREEFNISNVLSEENSLNTRENAINSAKLLRALSIDTIVLVTNAAHMPRAVAAFERTGLTVVPAPTLFFPSKPEFFDIGSYLPTVGSLYEIRYALHEYLGQLWYWLRDDTAL